MIGLGRLRVGLGAVGLTVAGFCWMPEGMADSFYLKTGDVVEGEIIQATRNTVIIRSDGSVRPTSLGLIERVVLTLADGSELNGDLLGWKDGRYEVRSADLLMQVEDGKVVDDKPEIAVAEQNRGLQPVAEPSLPEAKPAEVIAMQGLPAFTLKSGEVLIGQIIHVTGSIATIRLYGGGVVPTSRAQIDAVRFLGNGDLLNGSFVGWSNNVYQLKNGEQDVAASLSDAAAQAGPPSELLQSQADAVKPQESQADTVKSLDKPEIAVIESTDAAVAPDAEDAEKTERKPSEQEDPTPISAAKENKVADTIDAANTTGVGGPVSEAAVSRLEDQQTSRPEVSEVEVSEVEVSEVEANSSEVQSPYLIEPTVADVGEDGDEVVFEFRLQEPTDRPLVILYAATDDTAKAGQDFEAKSGVVTFGAGSKYAEVRVPLIDDEQSETSEQFHLFLSGDPETIQFSQRQVPATINDND